LVEDTLRQNALDLRATLFDCIASAQKRILLASPFWDRTTTADITEIFVKRLSSGVLIDVLGRGEQKIDDDFLSLVKCFASYQGIRFYSWFKPFDEDPSKIQTFHFKAAVIDNGERAYLGSANMTSGGLRSRMELGVVLRGDASVTLARILESVLSISTCLSESLDDGDIP
jgi:phosphatidylserine/phosphatidylglycerophosphate/cardiolipin synthase-like enzyme